MTVSRGRRRRLDAGERAQVWRQWRAGDDVQAICAGLAVSPSVAYAEVDAHGGIAPQARTRRPDALDLTERQLLSEWRVGERDGLSYREAGRRLGRAHTTLAREIARHGIRTATSRRYDPAQADRRAWARARRPKRCRLAQHAPLRAVVAAKLGLDWSPTQISAWLRVTYPDVAAMQLSPETIYRSLYVQARGVLKRELTAHLRRGHPRRQTRGRMPRARAGAILDGISIAARPPEVADRAVPGHWEGDLLLGDAHSQIATLVERASRFVVLVALPARDSTRVVDALIAAAQHVPTELQHALRSLTWDRGAELAQHQRFTLATDMQVYFCDPRSPWQRGTNENTNGLLRQYFPKGKSVAGIPQADLDAVAHRLNTRPRQTLGWLTPAQALSRLLRGGALTG